LEHGSVPGPSDIAAITVPGFNTVTADANPTVLGINTGIGATLAIQYGTFFTATAGTVMGANRGTIAVNDYGTLQVGGTFNNPGQIDLGSIGDPTSLVITRDTTLKGGGVVVMTDSLGNTIGTTGFSYPGPTLTNVDNTIAGAGTIGPFYYMTFINESLVWWMQPAQLISYE
jgi:hypothetical protein